MDSNQATTRNVDLVDSMHAVTFDADRERFQATYDSTRDSTSLAVVAVVATVLGKDPEDLPPLYSIIDTDALDKLVTESANGRTGCNRVTFCYDGLEVTISSDGIIEAETET